jgi:hypothetical protein
MIRGVSGVIGSVRIGSSPPEITSSAAVSVVEGATDAGTTTAIRGQEPYTFSISGGADAALFTINASTGARAFAVAPDYFDPGDVGANNVYNVTVRVASVGVAYVEQAIAVTVEFSPLSLSPLLWVDATRGVFSDAGTTPAVNDDPVFQINEFSGNSRTVTQANVDILPHYKTNILNGLPGILFASDQRMFSTLTRASVSGSSVWYAGVVTVQQSGSEREYYGFVNAGTFHQWQLTKQTDDVIISNGYDGSGHSASFLAPASASGVCIVNTFNNDGDNEIYRDGVIQNSVAAGSPSIGSSTPFGFGLVFWGTGYYLHECLVMSGEPTPEQIANVTAYLMEKWGVG